MIFFGSTLALLEPKLELFEVWEFGSWCHWQWWWSVARLSTIYLLFACKIFLLPVPTRPGTWNFLQVPDPSRPEVKKPYPSDTGRGSHFCRGRGGACIPGLFVALWEKVHFPRCGRFSTFRSWVMAVFVKKTWPTRQKVFPLPTVGALSASNSPSALKI